MKRSTMGEWARMVLPRLATIYFIVITDKTTPNLLTRISRQTCAMSVPITYRMKSNYPMVKKLQLENLYSVRHALICRCWRPCYESTQTIYMESFIAQGVLRLKC